MNLLIPTTDGISILSEFEKADKFRFITIVNGSIKTDEIRIVKNGIEDEFFSGFGFDSVSDKITDAQSVLNRANHLADNFVMITSISEKSEKRLNDNNFVVLRTEETNITNAIIFYLKYYAIQESDYCCCP